MKTEQIKASKKALYQKLAGCKVWIPMGRKKKDEITLELLVSGDGKRFIPAFYSKGSELGSCAAESLVCIPFSQLRLTLIDAGEEISGIVIEPFGENTLLDRKALMEYDSVTRGMSVERYAPSGRVGFAVCSSLPEGMKEALQKFFERQIGVNRAWALLAKPEQEKQPHLCIMVDFIGSKVQLFPLLAEAVKPYMCPGEQFELKPLLPQMDMNLFRAGLIYERTNQNHLTQPAAAKRLRGR